MIYIIDIDGTICTQEKSPYYHNAKPYLNRINQINDLYEKGDTIIYWTARGAQSNIDHSVLTKRQLKEWNCKYHELKFGKPHYDKWVDDKADWIFEE